MLRNNRYRPISLLWVCWIFCIFPLNCPFIQLFFVYILFCSLFCISSYQAPFSFSYLYAYISCYVMLCNTLWASFRVTLCNCLLLLHSVLCTVIRPFCLCPFSCGVCFSLITCPLRFRARHVIWMLVQPDPPIYNTVRGYFRRCYNTTQPKMCYSVRIIN